MSSPNKSSPTSSSQTSDQKLTLSPFKALSSSNPSTPISTQNRYGLVTQSQSYSSLVKSPISVPTPSTPNRYTIISPNVQKTVAPSSQKSSSSKSSSYIVNSNVQIVKILDDYEIGLQKQGFQTLTDFLFPKDSLFTVNSQRSREYYEAILIDTGSIRVTHNKNQTSNQIDFSKIQIFRILSIQDWKARPYTVKTLSNYHQYPYYNYYDYQEAWFNIFYLRAYTHSWFIFFDKNFNPDYPRWFVKWFKYMGNFSDTFPQYAKDGLSKFKEIFVQDIPEFEYVLQFTILFKIPWILSWTFNITPAQGISPSLLQRISRVKWWDKLPEEQKEHLTIQGVANYYSTNFGVPATLMPPLNQQSTLQTQEDEEIAQFMSANSREEIQKLIQVIKQGSTSTTQGIPSTPSSQENSLFQDSQDPYQDVKL